MPRSLREITYGGILFLLIGAAPTAAQPASEPAESPEVSVYARGLIGPLSLEFDARGRLWVAEQGTGNDDGGISVVTPDGQVHPFLTRQRSLIYYGSPLSVEQIHFHSNRLWATYVEGSFMAIDTTGFSPEGPPLALDTTLVVNIKRYLQGEGYPESNPYDFTVGPDNDLYCRCLSLTPVAGTRLRPVLRVQERGFR